MIEITQGSFREKSWKLKGCEILENLETANELVHVFRWAVDKARHSLGTRLKVTDGEQNAP